jgi:hypothetical protein
MFTRKMWAQFIANVIHFVMELLKINHSEFAIRNMNNKGTISATSRITPIDQVEVLNLCTCTLFTSGFLKS